MRNMEMYQSKDKSFIIFYVTFKLYKIYRIELCNIWKDMYTVESERSYKNVVQ